MQRAGRTELGQVERVRIEAMERRQLLHELPCDRQLLGGIGDLREAARALHAAEEERGLGRVHRDELGDPQRRRTERPVHRGLARQRVQGVRLRAEAGVGAQPQRGDGAVGELGVDRVPGAGRASDAAMDGEAGRAGRLADPRLERGVEIVGHGGRS